MTSPIGDPVLLKSPENKTLFKRVPSLDEFGKLGNIHDCHLLVDRVQKVDEQSALSTLRSFWIIEGWGIREGYHRQTQLATLDHDSPFIWLGGQSVLEPFSTS